MRRLRLWDAPLAIVFALALGSSLPAADDPLAPNRTIALETPAVHPTLSPDGASLYWLNPTASLLQRVSLTDDSLEPQSVSVALGARDFCLAPDGRTAWVAATANDYTRYRKAADQLGTIQTITLPDLTVTDAFEVKIDPYEMVCGPNNLLYVTPGSGQWVSLHRIDPRARKDEPGKGQIYGGSNLRITPDRRRVYLATNGLNPGDLSASTLPTNGAQVPVPADSRYHGEHNLGGAFDVTSDGRFIVNRNGVVVRLGPVKDTDLVFVAQLESNTAAACDPAAGKLWLAHADGRLLTYAYPALTLEKTDLLTSAATALIYDAPSQTLWAAWVAGPSAGLDAYDLAHPAPYPNDIVRARSEPRTPRPIARSTTPAVNAPDSAATPSAARSPTTAADREANVAAVRQDPIVVGLLTLCSLFFLGSLFLRRRPAPPNPLRPEDSDPEDPRNWPLPGSIKFIGWFSWFQVALMVIVNLLGLPGSVSEATYRARILVGIAALVGGFAWGILRGNKLCYVGYVLMLSTGLVLSVSRGGSPGYVALIWLFVVLYYGRKNWDSLS